MKKVLLLCLDEFTHDQVFSWPMKHLGAEVSIYGGKGDPNKELHWAVETVQPDVVVWSGVCGGESMPRIGTLRWLRERARSVMICWDAGHRDWHPYLDQYAKHDTFDLICGVDGSFDWPRRKQDLPCLCPINPEWYDGASADRSIDLGFMGSYDADSRRGRLLGELGNLVTIQRRTGAPGRYADYADFVMRCRALVNVAHSAGDGPMHVKARCVEAAWAGCMLFETRDSPLRKWIDPTDTYVEYNMVERIAIECKQPKFAETATHYGQRLREAMQPHHPRHFWEQVIGN